MLTYTLTYTNATGQTVRGVSLHDELPAGVRYLSGGTLVGDAVIWLLGDLPAGASNSVSLSVEVEDGVASVSNVASIDSEQQGQSFSNQVDMTVLTPILTVTKSVNAPEFGTGWVRTCLFAALCKQWERASDGCHASGSSFSLSGLHRRRHVFGRKSCD